MFWADLKTNPSLLSWLSNSDFENEGRRAIVVGCGVGDDTEALIEIRYEVTAFDISPEAIRLCKERYPDIKVKYIVADLFNYSPRWTEIFDLVYECNII